MKKIYDRPSATTEMFAVNDVVASCLQVELTCAIPGSSPYYVNDGTNAYNNHGICGSASTTFVNSSTGSGYERVKGDTDYKRPITNVSFGRQITGDVSTTLFSPYDRVGGSDVKSTGYYYAQWQSTDNRNNTGTYSHYGLAHVTDIDPNRPNHS